MSWPQKVKPSKRLSSPFFPVQTGYLPKACADGHAEKRTQSRSDPCCMSASCLLIDLEPASCAQRGSCWSTPSPTARERWGCAHVSAGGTDDGWPCSAPPVFTLSFCFSFSDMGIYAVQRATVSSNSHTDKLAQMFVGFSNQTFNPFRNYLLFTYVYSCYLLCICLYV